MTLARRSLLASHQLAHSLFAMVTAELPQQVAERVLPGSCISRISPILAHAVLGEDLTVNRTLRGAPTILENGGWAERTGILGPSPAMTPDWLSAAYDLEQVKDYATAVFGDTERYLEEATTADLARLVLSPIGTHVTGLELLSSFNLLHLMLHTGEVAALKGVQGSPGGLPF